MADSDEDLLILEREKAKARIRLAEAPQQAQANAPGFLENLTGGPGGFFEKAGTVLGDVTNAAYGMIKPIMEPRPFPDPAIWDAPTDKLNQEQLQVWKDNPVSTAMGMGLPVNPADLIPGFRTTETVASRLGQGQPISGGDAGTMLRQELAGQYAGAGLIGAARAVPGMVKGTVQGVRDYVKGGIPRADYLAGAAPNQEIYGNVLNAGKNSSIGENKFVQRVDDYHQEFTDANPVAGIDPSTGRAGFIQFKNNLDKAVVDGINTRSSILKNAAEIEATKNSAMRGAEALGPSGVSFEAIPRDVNLPDGRTSGLTLIERTQPEGAIGVKAATDYVRSKFGIVDETPIGGSNYTTIPGSPGRPLSVTELNDLRMGIDAELRGLEAYDVNAPHPTLSPSALNSTASAFKHYRAQIDNLLKEQLSELVGPAQAAAFDAAGGQIGMGKTYKQLADRFQAETGQGFTPGSAKTVPPGKGLLETQGMVGKARALIPGEDTQIQTQTLQRESRALQDLQTLIAYNDGSLAKPAPRGWAQIKSSAQHLTNVGNIAIGMGLIQDPQQLLSMPDHIASQVVAEVAKVAPEAFEPTPDNINAMDGEYKDPIGQEAMYQKARKMPLAEQARIIGAGYDGNRYEPSKPVTPEQAPPLPPFAIKPNLKALNKSLAPSFSLPEKPDNSYDQSSMEMLESLTNSQELNREGRDGYH